MLTSYDHRYKGVLSKLAEQDERNQMYEDALQKGETLIAAQRGELDELRGTCADHEQKYEDLACEYESLEMTYKRETIRLEKERKEAVAWMVEELNQEHRYRKTAESEIATKDTSYTKLQIDYEKAKSEIDEAKKKLEEDRDLIEAKQNEIEDIDEELVKEREEKQEVEQAFDKLEAETTKLESDIKSLTNRLAQTEDTVEEQDKELEVAREELKDRETEINQLRSDVFGAQEDVKNKGGIIAQLEKDINALNKSMQDLTEEKDSVIEDKNLQLDDMEDKIDLLSRDNEQKDSDIEALRKENLSLIAAADELRKALATRGKDVRVLRDITNQLVGEGESDIAAQRDWVARKVELLSNVRQAVATVSDASDAATTLTQKVEETRIVKKTLVRDSGYLGEDGEQTEGMIMETGY